MIVLLILIVAGIGAAVFATQNTITTSLTFGDYMLREIPVYLVALGSLLIGIFVSWVIHVINILSDRITTRGKDGSISNAKREIAELNKEIHKLELENTRLKTRLGEDDSDDNSL